MVRRGSRRDLITPFPKKTKLITDNSVLASFSCTVGRVSLIPPGLYREPMIKVFLPACLHVYFPFRVQIPCRVFLPDGLWNTAAG